MPGGEDARKSRKLLPMVPMMPMVLDSGCGEPAREREGHGSIPHPPR